MDRRAFVAGAAALLAAPLAAQAQPAAKVYRIGFLGDSTPALEANLVGPFREGLCELGYVEGHNILIEYRWAEGQYERFPALIAELLAQKVDVIVTAGTPASLAVKKATTSVPLVMVAVGDPVATGLVPSLAQPGGSITGLTSIAGEIEGKRLELLRAVVPTISHVALLGNLGNASQKRALDEVKAAAAALQMKVLFLDVRAANQLDGALASIVRERAGGLIVFADRLFLHDRVRIMDFATRHRLPGVRAYRELVEAGGLMSFVAVVDPVASGLISSLARPGVRGRHGPVRAREVPEADHLGERAAPGALCGHLRRRYAHLPQAHVRKAIEAVSFSAQLAHEGRMDAAHVVSP